MDVLKLFLPLCWLKNNPLDLPRSVDFFKQNLIFCFVIEYLLQTNMTDDPFESFIEVGIETMLTLIFMGVMLFVNRTLYAYIQVTTAVLFCTNVVAVFMVPVLFWLTITETVLSYYFFSMLLLWEFVTISHILKKVLSINMLAGGVLTLFYFVVTYFGAFALGQLI